MSRFLEGHQKEMCFGVLKEPSYSLIATPLCPFSAGGGGGGGGGGGRLIS